MAVKKNRVLKKDWDTFIADFNEGKRFGLVNVFEGEFEVRSSVPLVGILYDEDLRKMIVFAGTEDPDSVCDPVCDMDVPRGVYSMTDSENDQICGLQIQGKPGTSMIRVECCDEDSDAGRHDWIKSVAQALYERRGEEEGAPEEDWLQAEKIVEDGIKDRFHNS